MKIIYDTDNEPRITIKANGKIITKAHFYKIEILTNSGEHVTFSNWTRKQYRTMKQKIKFIDRINSGVQNKSGKLKGKT